MRLDFCKRGGKGGFSGGTNCDCLIGLAKLQLVRFKGVLKRRRARIKLAKGWGEISVEHTHIHTVEYLVVGIC